MSNLTNQLISNILFWLSRKKWLVIAFFISVSLFYVETPKGLTSDAHRTLIIVVTALILIVSESIPLPAIAMLILIMEVVVKTAWVSQKRIHPSELLEKVSYLNFGAKIERFFIQKRIKNGSFAPKI